MANIGPVDGRSVHTEVAEIDGHDMSRLTMQEVKRPARIYIELVQVSQAYQRRS